MGKKLSRSVDLPVISRQASIQSFDEEKRTAEMVFATGHQVRRFDWFEGEFMEELSMDPKHVDMGRINQGAVQFLRDHGKNGRPTIDDVMGIVEEASFDGERGIATVRFSERDEVQGFIADIRSGILRNVSVGYRVRKFQKVAENDGVPVLRAVEWEPLEISSVAIGADPAAGFRSARSDGEQTNRCEVIGMSKERTVEPEKKNETPAQEGVENERALTEDNPTGESHMENAAKAKSEGVKEGRELGAKEEGERRDAIEKACRAAKLEDTVRADMIKRGISADEARSEIIELLAKRDEETETRSVNSGVSITRDESETRAEAIKEAIAHRAAPEHNKLTDLGREWVGLSLLETVREFARLNGVRGVNRLSKVEVAGLAFKRAGMHTSSDFPSILEDLMGKTLRQSYLAAPQTFSSFVREVTNPDFKDVSRAQLGLGAGLLEVPASGEIKEGTISESAEKYALKQFGRKYTFDRKMIINDDLDAFGRVSSMLGMKARSLESDLVYQVLTANANMADGNPLFDATHANLAAAAAISIASLGLIRASMRKQTDPDGEKLNLRPEVLIVPAALETVAEQLVSSQLNPDDTSKVNPFNSTGNTPLSVVVESRLDDDSAISWYMAASKSQIDTIELAKLQGSQEPEVRTEELFDSFGMKIRVGHDVAAKAIDWRGLAKNPGA